MWITEIYVKGKKKPITMEYKQSKDSDRSFNVATSMATEAFDRSFIAYKEGKNIIYKNSSEIEKAIVKWVEPKKEKKNEKTT